MTMKKSEKLRTHKIFWDSFEKWSKAKQKSTHAWRIFLKFPSNTKLKQKGNEEIKTSGRILIWGSCDEAGRKEMTRKYQFYDVLSLENIVQDLIVWKDIEYEKWRPTKLI